MPRDRSDRSVRGRPRARAGRQARRVLGGDRVEGWNAVRELLVAGARQVDELVVSASAARSSRLEEIVAIAEAKSIPVRTVSGAVFESLASSSAPQGVMARAAPISDVGLDVLVAEGASPSGRRGRGAPFLIVLAEVTDPQNFGAILRSALGAGATGVVVSRHRSASLSASAVKAAAGAVEHVPIAAVGSIAQAVAALRRFDVWTVGLDADGETNIFELEVADRPLALVAGAEGRGLPALVRSRCDLLCRIPMHGPLGSLNVSVALGVAAFAVASRRELCEYRRQS